MRSDNVTKGVERAPNRSLFYALGYTKEELERPLIGVVCSYNEIVPGHMNLDKIAEAVKAGIRAAGGTPVEFPAIAVCDGIAMGHIGNTSRKMKFEARKVAVPRPDISDSAADFLAEPIVVAVAEGTCVTPKKCQRIPH